MSSLSIPRRRRTLVALASLTMLAAFGAGCGSKDKVLDGKSVLAKVGDKEITADYYESKLVRLRPADLPRDDEGNLLDTAELAGKQKFLETIINKEVMVTVATRMGFDADPQIEYTRKTLTEHEAGAVARARFINKPASAVEEADIQEFYENLGRSRKCRYFIANTRERALAGREKALSGADWADVFAEFHDGMQMADMSYDIEIQYGRFIPSYEDPIFACKVGDITDPVPSSYGWWVLKVDSEAQAERPSLEEARATIVATIVNRSQMRLLDAFKQEVRTKYKMYLNEAALLKAYEGLPKDEPMFYPDTNEPKKREDLAPLNVAPADYDLDFYGYEIDGEARKYTLGDFKAVYDKMNVFERPKWGDMLGGLRQKISDEVEIALLAADAEARGLHTDPEVVAKVNEKIEELLVRKLFEEGVHSDETVLPAALDSAWALLKNEYDLPETRSGLRIICANADQAAKAHAALTAGKQWREVLTTYGAEAADKATKGILSDIRADAQGPEKEALFALLPDQFSSPTTMPDGRSVIVRLDRISPPRTQELAEIAQAVVGRIQAKREDEAFRAALEGWKKQVKIVVHEDKLRRTRSWKELTDAANQTAAAAAK